MRRLAILTVLVLSLLGAPAAAADAATLVLTPGADPVEDQSLAVGVSGTSLANRYVYVDIKTGDTACAASEYENYAARIGSYPTGSTTSFSHTATYTPSDPGTYTLCGYVTQNAYATPDTTKRATFSVRQPHATLALSPSTDAVEDQPVSVAVTGTTEGPSRNVYVDIRTGDTGCAASEYENYAARIGSYSTGSTTSFSETATYTPSDPGTYTLCGYVTQNAYATPDTTKRATFSVRQPHATLALSPSTDAVEDRPVSVAVTGTTEGPSRNVYVDIRTGDTGCAASEYENYAARIGSYSTGSTTSFSETATYTPSDPGTYTLCGYVTENAYATPDTTKRATFSVPGGPVSPSDGGSDGGGSVDEEPIATPAPRVAKSRRPRYWRPPEPDVPVGRRFRDRRQGRHIADRTPGL